MRSKEAAALVPGEVVSEASLRVGPPVVGVGPTVEHYGRGGWGMRGRRFVVVARADVARTGGSSPGGACHVVVDCEEAVCHEPRVDHRQVRLTQEVVLAEVGVSVQPLLHLAERYLRHFSAGRRPSLHLRHRTTGYIAPGTYVRLCE